MLKSLHIENIAVIEKTDIDFSKGFNCLTGETGAGKSIVIDSINAVLGERTSKDLIRTSCEKAEVSAVFSNLSREAIAVLSENGYQADCEGNVLINRVLSLNGGSVKICGKPATVGILKEIGKSLVNIHGQHDSQQLLNPDNHISYIDKIAENEDLKEKYYAEFKHFNSVRKELKSLECDREEKVRKTEFLKYQINEIESADITIGETENLKKQLQLVENYEKTTTLLNEAYAFLNGNEDKDGAVSLLRNAQKNVSEIGEPLKESNQKLNEMLSILESVTGDIRSLSNNTQLSVLSPEQVRERLDLLRSLMLKYGGSEESVIEYLNKSKAELADIEFSKEKESSLSKEIDLSTERLIDLGNKLSLSREKAAKYFSQKVTDTLIYLNMPDVCFETVINKGKYTKIGCDEIEFFIRTNAGDNSKPLCKIASGGELSRIMLAIKSVLADKDDVDTLIFDEIDSGISGITAQKVGTQLKFVSKIRQVICVTHLAQIAAFADNHLLIEKNVKNGKTYTEVNVLDENECIKELARIMSGGELTENLYNSAKELLNRSRKI